MLVHVELAMRVAALSISSPVTPRIAAVNGRAPPQRASRKDRPTRPGP
jgi:hypothetical protein